MPKCTRPPQLLRYARVGDFYEFLGPCAIAACQALADSLHLGRRSGTPMTGFPVVKADAYFSCLRAAGYELQELPTLAALKAAAQGEGAGGV